METLTFTPELSLPAYRKNITSKSAWPNIPSKDCWPLWADWILFGLILTFTFVHQNLLAVFSNPHWTTVVGWCNRFNTVNETKDERTKHKYQPQFLLEQILCWSKTQLETGLQSWCMECMSEWDSSLFSFEGGNRAAEVNIHLKQTSNERNEW